MADVKRPTAQDIEDFRQVLDGGMRQSLGSDTTTPDHAATVWQLWVRFTGVLDYAADCLRAEEEGERVPEVGPDTEGRVVELTWDDVRLADATGVIYGEALASGEWTLYRRWGWPTRVSNIAPTQTAARISVEACLPPHCKVTNPETPEDAGEYPCAGGCGTMLEPPFAPGDICDVCAAVAQMMAGRDIATIKLLRSELSAARWTIRKALALLDCGNVEHARRTLAHAVGLGSGPVYGGEE